MKRRNFLQTSLVATGLAAARHSRAAAGATPVRVAVNGLSANAPEVRKYATAVDLRRRLPGTDPRNWVNLAKVHNDFCPHANWWFLPWHRAYLYYFELTCQDVLADPTFRLPYWDWTSYPRIPGPFLNQSSSLWDGTRDSGGNIEIPTEVVGAPVIQNIAGSSNWIDLFSGATLNDQQRSPRASGVLEATPHNGVHGIVGGDMGNYMSPLDPIFWLHHCNVDRIWASWARIPNHSGPPDTLWQNHKLAQFYDPVAKKQITPAAGTTTDPTKYNAVYDHYVTVAAPGPALTTSIRRMLSAQLADSAPQTIRRLSIEAAPKTSGGSVAAFAASMNADFSSTIQKAIQPTADNFRTANVSLVMQDIERPSSPSVALRVFLNCKDPSLNTPLDDPTYVGTLAFFGGDHGEDHGAGTTYSLDVSRTLARTIRAGIYTPQTPIDVSLVPVDLRNPKVAPPDGVVKPNKVQLIGLAV